MKDGTADGGSDLEEGDVPLRASVRAAKSNHIDWVALEQDVPAKEPEALFARFHALVSGTD
ncbi:hypothetical protein [Streptomyces sp. S186]|uniref:hypothetical protein n=1 Tax=Streptomyces sp. S186 TaxID=3434395 RepID=UPI003F664B4C